MPIKNHPFFQAPAGAVFAIEIAPNQWGFVRFFRGLAMGVLSVIGSAPAMPGIHWSDPPIAWVFFSFAPNSDTTNAVALGMVPFDDEFSEWAPPCFEPPDVIVNYYRILEQGMIRRHATEADVAGMMQCRTMTPALLAQFLRERLAEGELRPI